MSRDKLPTPIQYRKGDEVQVRNNKVNVSWNGKRGIITGTYVISKQQWPVEIYIGFGKIQTFLEPKYFTICKYGPEWTIDTSSTIQRLNLLLKAYTRDLEAFAKLTIKQQRIFDNDFSYKMHDDLMANSLIEFDRILNILKNAIIRLSAENRNNKNIKDVERYLIDKTQVIALDNTLKKFQVNVMIKIGNNKLWQRISEIHIHETTNLIKFGKIISINIIDDPKPIEDISNNNDNDNKMNEETKGIINAINNKSRKNQTKVTATAQLQNGNGITFDVFERINDHIESLIELVNLDLLACSYK